MTEPDDRQIREALQQSFPSVNPELTRDLWPAVLQKLDTRIRVPWYDWALMAVTAAMLVLFPQVLFVFAYHL
jgi:hypothetical protein